MKKILILFSIALTLISCNDLATKKSGKIDFELVIYDEISKTKDSKDLLPNIYPISSLYFYKNKFLEIIPPHDTSGALYQIISDGNYFSFNNLLNVPVDPKKDKVELKKFGIKFNVDSIPEGKIKPMTDTTFNGYNYKRLSIDNKATYTIFYFHKTDTLLPYSLNRTLEQKHKGWLNRVDTYDYKKDQFSSLRLVQNDTVPQTIFQILNTYK